MRKYISLIGLILIICSYSFSQSITLYEIEIDKELWKNEPIIPNISTDRKYLNDGNLYIHFQTDFQQDSSQIKINGELFGTYTLTTEWSTAVADVIQIPDFNKIKTVSISINNGKEAQFETNELNQIVVRYREDLLFIGFRKHVPFYD